MTRQKRGFWLFIFSLIPGAGEMYMGFKKQGTSLMLLFWGDIAFSAFVGIGGLLFIMPVLWFYSFFNVHNLKNMTEEEFYSVEDDYVIHSNIFTKNYGEVLKKHRAVVACVLIVIGITMLGKMFMALPFFEYFHIPGYNTFSTIVYEIPKIAISLGIIGIGIHLVRSKKKELVAGEEA